MLVTDMAQGDMAQGDRIAQIEQMCAEMRSGYFRTFPGAYKMHAMVRLTRLAAMHVNMHSNALCRHTTATCN